MKTFNSGNFNHTVATLAKALGIVVLLSSVDAIFGAGISAGLWPNISSQQAVLDIYQSLFGLIVFSVLWFARRCNFDTAFSALLLLIAYVEDTLYYLLLPITKHVVLFLSHGKLIVEPGFPNRIGGYLGWLTRFFGIVPTVDFPLWIVLAMNITGLAVACILLWKQTKKE